ncbi:MAG: SPFH domain-containing protein [Chitinispirillaceae bacterium]|nr:SPFH domain-containing protein [Chitinispirillaceae bacterium]
MGIIDKIRGEFIDIIEWQDTTRDTIVWRFPRYNNEIKMGAQLTVRESQVAVFINKGKIADIFTPGMYTLQTDNLPVLSTLSGWKYGFDSPFKADVCFVSTRQFTDLKWGTRNPITVEDKRFGFIELRAFGTYAFSVADAGLFIRKIAATNEQFSTDGITGQLRSLIVTKLTDAIGEGNIPVEKFAASIEELSGIARERLSPDFRAYGLALDRFLIENISMPDELKKEIFEYSRLEKIDMEKLARMKSAKSIEKAAENPGGVAGAGVGMGVGIGMGNMMGNMFGSQMNGAPAMPPPLPPATETSFYIAVGGKQTGPFPIEQLIPLVEQRKLTRETLVWKQGMAQWNKAGKISDLGILFSTTPPPLPGE